MHECKPGDAIAVGEILDWTGNCLYGVCKYIFNDAV
jgi:hypothetical protein